VQYWPGVSDLRAIGPFTFYRNFNRNCTSIPNRAHLFTVDSKAKCELEWTYFTRRLLTCIPSKYNKFRKLAFLRELLLSHISLCFVVYMVSTCILMTVCPHGVGVFEFQLQCKFETVQRMHKISSANMQQSNSALVMSNDVLWRLTNRRFIIIKLKKSCWLQLLRSGWLPLFHGRIDIAYVHYTHRAYCPKWNNVSLTPRVQYEWPTKRQAYRLTSYKLHHRPLGDREISVLLSNTQL